MPRYFQKIPPDIIAILAVIKKMLVRITLTGSAVALFMPEYDTRIITFVLISLRELIGEVIKIRQTGKIDD